MEQVFKIFRSLLCKKTEVHCYDLLKFMFLLCGDTCVKNKLFHN